MKLHACPALAMITLLTNCAQSVPPYSEQIEKSRAEARDFEQTTEHIIYSDGKLAGQRDASVGDPDNYRRHSPLYTQATEKPFADGYRDGYHATAPVRDEAYKLGLDLGSKDHALKKECDPDAHIGEYNAASRGSFVSGYLEGYNR